MLNRVGTRAGWLKHCAPFLIRWFARFLGWFASVVIAHTLAAKVLGFGIGPLDLHLLTAVLGMLFILIPTYVVFHLAKAIWSAKHSTRDVAASALFLILCALFFFAPRVSRFSYGDATGEIFRNGQLTPNGWFIHSIYFGSCVLAALSYVTLTWLVVSGLRYFAGSNEYGR